MFLIKGVERKSWSMTYLMADVLCRNSSQHEEISRKESFSAAGGAETSGEGPVHLPCMP